MLRTFFCKILLLLLLPCLLEGCAAVVAGTAVTSVMVVQDRRTTGTIVDDKTIQIKALQVIHEVGYKKPAVHVNAITYNNHVLLVGQAPTRQMRSLIEKNVRRIERVTQVYNEISVEPATSMKVRAQDSYITAKIKSQMALKKFNPTRVKVVTENKIVYLMGIVNKQEESIAVDIARLTHGVVKVVKIFEYD